MAIVVADVASSRKTPGIYQKIYPGTSGAGGTAEITCVFAGQALATGTMSAGDIEACYTTNEAESFGGEGSELHLGARGFFEAYPEGVLYLGAVTAGTTASTRTVTFANAATADGYYYIWLDSHQYTLTISNGDSIANMADNLAAGIIAAEWYGDLPYTVVSDTISKITITTKNLGPQSQWMLEAVHQKTNDLPGTTTATLSATTPSAGSAPTVTALVTALTPGTTYDYIAWTNVDSTAITAIEAYIDGQNAPNVGNRMQAFYCSADTYTNAKTMAQTNCNHRESSVLWSQTDNETYCETLGRALGLAAKKDGSDPAYPYGAMGNYEKLPGYRGHSSDASYPSATQIENCLNNSLTPVGMQGADGGIVRWVTSYSLNGATPDYSCLDRACVTVPHYIADTLEATLQVRFAGMKLADDYTEPSDTPRGVVTPKMAKDVIYEVLKEAQDAAIVEEITDSIKAQIDAEVDASIAGRLNYECPVPVMGGAYVIAGNVRGF